MALMWGMMDKKIAISTSWMDDVISVHDWLLKVKALGVETVELSYKVSAIQLLEFKKSLTELKMGVSSIHNFCPTPNDGPSTRHISNYYRLSSVDEHERELAVKWTKIAVNTAHETQAPVVVIHAGTLDFEDERSPKLFKLFVDGNVGSPEFIEERTRILKLREEKRRPHLDAIEESLEEILQYSSQHNIKIGLETRYYPLEIPNFEEIGIFLNKFRSLGLGYWHDVGHAEINSRLGITKHLDFLDAYKNDLIGVHLHGMKGRRDHLAPFEGDMDWESLLPYFRGDVLKVIESKSFADDSLMQAAVNKLTF